MPQINRNQSAQEHQFPKSNKKQLNKTIRHHFGSHIAHTKHPPPLPQTFSESCFCKDCTKSRSDVSWRSGGQLGTRLGLEPGNHKEALKKPYLMDFLYIMKGVLIFSYPKMLCCHQSFPSVRKPASYIKPRASRRKAWALSAAACAAAASWSAATNRQWRSDMLRYSNKSFKHRRYVLMNLCAFRCSRHL